MALNNLGLGFIVTAKDMASPTFNKVGRSVQNMDQQASKGLRQVANTATASAVAVGLLATSVAGFRGLGKLAADAGEFELGMAQVAGISNIATDSLEAQKLGVTALGAAMKTQFSPKQATEGLTLFAGAGFKAAEQAELLVPALRLAQAGMIPVADSAKAMTAALKVFGIETDQAALTTDKLLKITNLTNLQAKDLSLALGTVGRGAGATKQSLDEMLISMGLVKNTGVEASVAASSVSSALLFMSKNADKFNKIGEDGVKITDDNGKFRDFLDIVVDTDKALAGITDEAEKAAVATELFGKFGLTAFVATSEQIKNGIKGAGGEILKGADAVAFLRQQMQDAQGTAAVFEDKILSTFEGQKKLLGGIAEGMAVALGQPFLQLMKPLLKTLLPLASSFVAFVQALPPSFKKTLALLTVGVFGLIGALGALLAMVTAIGFAAPLLVSGLGPILAAVAGVAVAIAVAVGAFKLFKFALDNNLGGLGDTFADIWAKVSLFARAIGQLLTEGFVSGDVLEGLLTPEMEGLREFIGALVRWGARIQAFWQGLSSGFTDFIAGSRSTFVEFGASIDRAVELFGELFQVIGAGSSGPMEQFTSVGQRIGAGLGKMVTRIVDFAGILIRFWAGFIRGVQTAKKMFQPFIDFLVEGVGEVVAEVSAALKLLGVEGSANGSVWSALGATLGWVVSVGFAPLALAIGVVAKLIGVLLHAANALIRAFKSIPGALGDAFGFLGGVWDATLAKLLEFSAAFKAVWAETIGFVTDIFGELEASLNTMLDFLAKVIDKIPERFRPEILGDFVASRQGDAQPSGSLAGNLSANVGSGFGLASDEARATAGRVIEQKATGDKRAASAVPNALQAVAAMLTKMQDSSAAGEAPGGEFRLFIDGRELSARVEKAKAQGEALAFDGG